MNHQPFENWLLSEEPLAPEQAQALRAHLSTCLVCQRLEQSWSEVQQLFAQTPPAAPPPGFTARWQARQAEESRQRQQRQAWRLLALTGGIAFLLMVFLGVYALDLFSSPEQLLMYVIYRASSLYFFGRASIEAVPGLLSPLVGALSLFVWLLALGGVSVLGVLWIVAYQKIMAIWRVRV